MNNFGVMIGPGIVSIKIGESKGEAVARGVAGTQPARPLVILHTRARYRTRLTLIRGRRIDATPRDVENPAAPVRRWRQRPRSLPGARLPPAANKFKLGYAPHPGMFKQSAGDDVIDQIKFCADQGFTAFEYNGLPSETPEMQEKIGKTLDSLGMQMGVFVAYGSFDRPTFARPTDETTAEILAAMREAVTIAKRVQREMVHRRPRQRRPAACQRGRVVESIRRPATVGRIPDGERDRHASPLRRDRRTGGSGDGARTVELARQPWRRLSRAERPGVRDLSRRQQPLLQDPVRHLSPADHRGQSDSEHRPVLE